MLGEVDIESEKVDHLASGIDFGLMDGFALADHRRPVQIVAPGRREKIRGFEENSCSILKLPVRPIAMGFLRGLNGHFRFLGTTLVPCGEHVAVLMRHDLCPGIASADLFTADQYRYVDFL